MESETERRLEELMAMHEPSESNTVADAIRTHASFLLTSIHPEVVAFGIVAHASAMLAAMKMTGSVRPELADALADDFSDTIKRRAISHVLGLRD